MQLGTLDQVLLEGLAQLHEVSAVTGDTHQHVLIILGLLLSGAHGGGV